MARTLRARPDRRHGSALIVVLGMLAVLSLLAVTFSMMSELDRMIALNYLNGVRARLIARGGIEDALARLRGDMPAAALASDEWMFFGDDITGNTVHEPGEDVLRRTDLELARRPSYPARDATGALRLATIEQRQRGVSGFLETASHGANTEAYSVRIRDTSGLIHVNDGVAQGNTSSVSQNTRRILDKLGTVAGVPGLGATLISKRPAIGYRTKGEVLLALSGDKAAFDLVEPFITLHAWQDSVANPVPLGTSMLGEYPVQYLRGSPGVFRYGSEGGAKNVRGVTINRKLGFYPSASVVSHMDAAVTVFDWTELNPQWIEIVSRAPVNVNAAPREVLLALLGDLQGFYLTDRRRNRPPATTFSLASNPAKYGGFLPAYSLSHGPGNAGWDTVAQRPEGDEIGFLYRTLPFLVPGETGMGVSASDVAEEILACRERRTSLKGFDYATCAFGGPFRSWAQFNAFCDNLVATGVLADSRAIFFDYDPATSDHLGYSATMVDSPLQRRRAAQALADVLKANFNPNLHLNELNPDANLHQLVDKTDLIVNSTEFCFVPTGYFEIESVGFVLRPDGSYADALLASNNEIAASSRVSCSVKLYDCYRETSQRQFMKGTVSNALTTGRTAWGKSLEIGPEPANGPAAWENGWDGYLVLPTLGAIPTLSAPSKTAIRTPAGAAEAGERLHVHFQLDTEAHYSALGSAVNGRSEVLRNTVAGGGNEDCLSNHALWTETGPGPYDATVGTAGRHRLARSFTKGDLDAGLTLTDVAPTNMRLEGAYSGVHTGLGYYTRSESPALFTGFATGAPSGTVSFWYKPAYAPELTGKMRCLFNYSRITVQNKFLLMFLPVHSLNPDAATPTSYAGYYSGYCVSNLPSSTLAYGAGVPHNYGNYLFARWGFMKFTQSLNHEGHGHLPVPLRSALSANRWTHIALNWTLARVSAGALFVNGQSLMKYDWTSTSGAASNPRMNLDGSWRNDEGRAGYPTPVLQNHVRFGSASYVQTAATPEYPALSLDGTIDEIFMWDGRQPALAQAQWSEGRYYRPLVDEAIYTSADILLTGPAVRALAAPSLEPPPAAGPLPPAVPAAIPPVEIMGVAWTWHGEETLTGDPAGIRRVLWDHSVPLPNKPIDPDDIVTIKVDVELSTPTGSTAWLPDDGFSQAGLYVLPGQPLTYRIRINLDLGGNSGAILLGTPVVDDVTIYYHSGLEFLSYNLETS